MGTYVADLHIHSYLSRACSKDLRPEVLHQWAQLKGITLLSTGDFTHPAWMEELERKLEPAEPGLFTLKKEWAVAADEKVPPKCRGPVRFILGVEISSIYKKGPRVRKVHNLVFAPSIETAKAINARLEKIGNIRSDGRPILGLDSKKLLELVLEATKGQGHLIPAHAWTPHFAVFGSESGFDSLEECFEDLTPHIFAIETGLSSDPQMNWRLSGLDKISLISNSDAHSPEKLAREANLIDAPLSYEGLFGALRDPGQDRLKTLEFFPEEGKYHMDGHRKCKTRLLPPETIQRQGLCPACGTPVTVGVLHRVERLADRAPGLKPEGKPGYENIVPLKEILSQFYQVKSATPKVNALYHKLLTQFGPELHILRELPLERLEEAGYPLLSTGLERMRRGIVRVAAGYDGEYGTISVLNDEDFQKTGELSLF